jgi:hypothetical protein
MHDPGNHEPDAGSDPDVQPLDPRLARRLLVAFLLIALLAIASAVLLPRAGLSIPWFVFALAFLAILAAALAPLLEGQPPEDDENSRDVAGRIGPGRRR